MIKIDHAHKLLEALDRVWLLKLPDGLNLVRQWSGAMLGDAVSEEINNWAAELALSDIDHKAIITKALKKLSQMNLVLRSVLAGYQVWRGKFLHSPGACL